MSTDREWLFSQGIPNPELFGIGLHWVSGAGPDPEAVRRVADMLGRKPRSVDESGYQVEIVSAAVRGDRRAVAYVRSRAKQLPDLVDVTFHLVLRELEGKEVAWEIETYNPFFGCDVRLLEWFDERVVIIYREKHHTYVCRLGFDQAVERRRIEDDWIRAGDVVGYRALKESTVRRVHLPDVSELSPLSEEDARMLQLLPTRRR